MDVNVISQLIGSIGFPIVAFLIMVWYLNKERESHELEVEKLNEALKEVVAAIHDLKGFVQRWNNEHDTH